MIICRAQKRADQKFRRSLEIRGFYQVIRLVPYEQGAIRLLHDSFDLLDIDRRRADVRIGFGCRTG